MARIQAVTFDLWDTIVHDDSDEPKRRAQGLRSKKDERRHLVWEALNRHNPIPREAVWLAYDVAEAAFNTVWHEQHVTWPVRTRLEMVLRGLNRTLPDEELVEAQRAMILDPNDPDVIAAAKANGIPDSIIKSAQKSPTYKYVKDWKIALPLHVEYRTFPMLFYVPPLLPVMSSTQGDDSDSQIACASAGVRPLPLIMAFLRFGRNERGRGCRRQGWSRRACGLWRMTPSEVPSWNPVFRLRPSRAAGQISRETTIASNRTTKRDGRAARLAWHAASRNLFR